MPQGPAAGPQQIPQKEKGPTPLKIFHRAGVSVHRYITGIVHISYASDRSYFQGNSDRIRQAERTRKSSEVFVPDHSRVYRCS